MVAGANKVRVVRTAKAERKPLSRWWAAVIGAGMALSPVHNSWLTNHLMNSKGEVVFFLPAFGFLLLIMGAGLFVLNNWSRVKRVGCGDRRVVIPLLVIVGAIGLSGVTADGIEGKVAPLGMGAALFALHLAVRVIGKDVFLPLAVGAVIASLGVLLRSIFYPGVVTGGFVFERNYDVMVGYVLLGTALLVGGKWQWLLCLLSVAAILSSGSPEGLFALAVLGFVVLWRRDWGKRLVYAIVVVVAVLGVWVATGHSKPLYWYASVVATNKTIPTLIPPEQKEDGQERTGTSSIGYKLSVIRYSLTHLKPLGEGYNLTDFSRTLNVHNTPLVIVQQLGWPGVLAALAWLWVTLWCLVKTRWKYAWTLIIALSVFDHYIWTQLAPVWWAVVGASTASTIQSDRIFKKGEA